MKLQKLEKKHWFNLTSACTCCLTLVKLSLPGFVFFFSSSGESRSLFRSTYVKIDKHCKFANDYTGDFLFEHVVCRVERGYYCQQIRLRDYRLFAHQACKGILGRVLQDWFLQTACSKSQNLDLQINKHTIKKPCAGQKEWIRSLAVAFGYFCIADVFVLLNPLETIRNQTSITREWNAVALPLLVCHLKFILCHRPNSQKHCIIALTLKHTHCLT